MRVSVFGLGYVGAVTCGCLAHDGFQVIGVDINPDKVRLMADGRSPIVEERIGDLIADGVRQSRLTATSDPVEAVLNSDVSIVAVGTPSQANGSLSVAALARVSEQIGLALRQKEGDHVVIVRSTVLPGTTRAVVAPAIAQASGRRPGDEFGVCFNPEFLREGSSVADYYDPPLMLVGADDDRTRAAAGALYEAVTRPVTFVPVETAEMVKYVCNAFHALKIAFANEVGVLAKACGVDSHVVMDLVCSDTKLNISHRYLRPGFAFGGSCLPKDLRALVYRAREGDVDLPLTGSILESNRLLVERAIETVAGLRRRKVSLLGLAFKAGTDDLRESPLVRLCEALIGKGLDVRVFDECVALARLMGANREYIEREIPHISALLVSGLEEAVAHAEVVVVGHGGQAFEGLAAMLRPGQVVVDLVRAPGLERVPEIDYRALTW